MIQRTSERLNHDQRVGQGGKTPDGAVAEILLKEQVRQGTFQRNQEASQSRRQCDNEQPGQLSGCDGRTPQSAATTGKELDRVGRITPQQDDQSRDRQRGHADGQGLRQMDRRGEERQ